MKKIILIAIIAALVVIIILVKEKGFLFPTNTVDSTVDSPKEKVLPQESESSQQESILPKNEFQEEFQALFIQQINPPVPMQDFTLKNLKGEQIDTKNLRGKLLWINFWTTGCPACVYELPSMQKAWEILGEDVFVLLAVNLGETKSKILSFLEYKRLKVTFPVLLDTSRQVFSVYGPVSRGSIPSHFFIDPEGNIIGVAVGAREWDNEKFYNLLQKLSEIK